MNVQKKAMIPGGLAAGGPVLIGDLIPTSAFHPFLEGLHKAIRQKRAQGGLEKRLLPHLLAETQHPSL